MAFPGWVLPVTAIGTNIATDLIGQNQASKDAEREREAIEQANLRNIQYQKEFAQQGIRWRVEDAKAAGVHPLVALGANTHQFNASVMPNYSDRAANAKQDTWRNMGQNVSRALLATSTENERIAQRLSLENMKLQNKLLETQITNITKPTNPPFPTEQVPTIQTGYQPERPWEQAGTINDVGYAVSNTGALVPVPSTDMKNRIEDQAMQEASWAYRNNLLPTLSLGKKANPPSDEMIQKAFPGAIGVKWSIIDQGWKPIYSKERPKGTIDFKLDPNEAFKYYNK